MFRRVNTRVILRFYTQSAQGPAKGPSSPAPPPPPKNPAPAGINANVPGLSDKVIRPAAGPTGFPGASHSGEYKVPEYYCYHRMSYHEAEIELAKYRLPQPVADTK